jgi:integrase
MGRLMGRPKGAHPVKRLTAVAVRNLGPGRHADGGGLYLEVDPSGARRWFLRTMVHGRRRDVGLGPTSLVGLAEAREAAARLRKVARSGGDPVVERDKDKKCSPTFEEAARHVYQHHVLPNSRNPKAMAQWLNRLELHAFPVIGKRPVHTIEQSDVLRVLSPIWLDKPETARRVRQRIKVVLDWARAAGHRAGINPVEGVEAGLPRQRDRVEHLAALPWRELPALWKKLETAEGMGALALCFAILTAPRSGEVRGATWSEINIDAGVWMIPRMKGGRVHRVPLSAAALAVLAKAKAVTSHSDSLVLPSRHPGKPLSDMTLSAVLKRLGVHVTVHGFRSTFRDWAEEVTAFSHEVKEAALAHVVKNRVEAAYRRTDLFAKRRDMMDAWANYATGGTPDTRGVSA